MLTPSRNIGEPLHLDVPIDATLQVAAPTIATTPNGALSRGLTAGKVQIETYLVSYPPVSSPEVQRGGEMGESYQIAPRVSTAFDGTEFTFGLEACDEIGPSALATMCHLLKAYDYARKLGVNAWDFAVEIDCLRRFGIGTTELRWLVGSGWIEQAQEITAAGDDRRVYSRGGFLTFDAQTCFVLTENGVAAARYLAERKQIPRLAAEGLAVPGEHGSHSTVERPIWIADRQQLYFGGDLVKEFKLPSPNQIAILAAFEEEEWPVHVDDPLPMSSSVGPKERLRYTIKSLNKHQKNRKIRFRGDGRGEGICWEVWEHSTDL